MSVFFLQIKCNVYFLPQLPCFFIDDDNDDDADDDDDDHNAKYEYSAQLTA